MMRVEVQHEIYSPISGIHIESRVNAPLFPQSALVDQAMISNRIHSRNIDERFGQRRFIPLDLLGWWI